MCLAIPGQVVEISGDGSDLLRSAKVDFGGASRSVSLAYVPEAKVGAWVVVHVGFALSVLEPEEAAQTIADLEAMAALEDER